MFDPKIGINSKFQEVKKLCIYYAATFPSKYQIQYMTCSNKKCYTLEKCTIFGPIWEFQFWDHFIFALFYSLYTNCCDIICSILSVYFIYFTLFLTIFHIYKYFIKKCNDLGKLKKSEKSVTLWGTIVWTSS